MPELYEAIAADWERLNTTLEGVDAREAMEKTDANGWTARDHVVNVIAWERSVVYLLNRRARHEALGISDDALCSRDIHAINEAIRSANAGGTWEDKRARLVDGHQDLMSTLHSLTWGDMQRPLRQLPAR